MNLHEVIPFLKVQTSQTWTVTSALVWEELVHRGNTVLRAQLHHDPAHQEPTPTGGFTLRIYRVAHLFTFKHCFMYQVNVIQHVCVFSLYLTDIFGCQACPPGHFCGTEGLSYPSGLCQAGFYCLGGDTKATGKKYIYISDQ